MSEPDRNAGSGLGVGAIVVLVVIGGVLFLMAIGALFFGFSRASYVSYSTMAYAGPGGSLQSSGDDEHGGYSYTAAVQGPDKQWALVWRDKPGAVVAVVFGIGVDPPIEPEDGHSVTRGGATESDLRRFNVRLDLTTDVAIVADGSKPLQVVTPQGLRELTPTLTGEKLSTTLAAVDPSNITATLRLIADPTEVDAMLQPPSR